MLPARILRNPLGCYVPFIGASPPWSVLARSRSWQSVGLMRPPPRAGMAAPGQRRSLCRFAGFAALVVLAVVSFSLWNTAHLNESRTRRSRILAEEFSIVPPVAHTPWLLPRGTKLPYSGLENDLDGLLHAQANKTVHGFPAVTMIFFNHHHRVMLMNCIYSLVKFAGVSSYIVLVWDKKSLDACLQMNLPCYNAAKYLPNPIGDDHQEALFQSQSYTQIMWFRPLVTSKVLDRGYAVHHTDVDIAYSPFDLYASFGAFMKQSGVTGVFMAELPVNGGNYFVLPTPAGRLLFQHWVSVMHPSIALGFHDQDGLSRLVLEAYDTCDAWSECAAALAARNETATSGTRRRPKALLRRTPSAYQELFGSWCAGNEPDKLTLVDPCQRGFSFAYFHVICATGAEPKIAGLKAIGYWFLDSSCITDGPLSKCKPRVWAQSGFEDAFLRCPSDRIAFNA